MDIFKRGDPVVIRQTRNPDVKFDGRVIDYNEDDGTYLVSITGMVGKNVTVDASKVAAE